jgi:hypothetical protein
MRARSDDRHRRGWITGDQAQKPARQMSARCLTLAAALITPQRSSAKRRTATLCIISFIFLLTILGGLVGIGAGSEFNIKLAAENHAHATGRTRHFLAMLGPGEN